MSAMIPGINNITSIGSRPTCRGGKAIVGGTYMTPGASSKGNLLDPRAQPSSFGN